MSIKYINHKGKQILYIDYSNCSTIEDSLRVLEMVKDEYARTTGQLLTLNNFEGAFGSTAYMNQANKYAKEIFNARTSKNAALGITGIKKILLYGHNTIAKDKIMSFDTKEEALDYLVK
ncbi:MAG: hypothetical protein ACERKD_24885 [Prolixibacteraceae bacterium]